MQHAAALLVVGLAASPPHRLVPSLPLPQTASVRRSHLVLSAESKRVADVVGGVHGGKYQFGPRGFEGYAGGQFASALAASTATGATDGSANEPWPSWASELRRPRGGGVQDAAAEDVHQVELGPSGTVTLRVTNVYRTWERFYVSLYSDGGEGADPLFEVTPRSGDLAPRGGANNVCDVSQPYLDHVDLVVEARTADGAATMLVRTEEDRALPPSRPTPHAASYAAHGR